RPASHVSTSTPKPDTALSVTLTSTSTLLAPLLTPLITLWLAGPYLPVAAGGMALSIVQMVLVPVLGGLVIRLVAGPLVTRILPALPWVSAAGISQVVVAVVSGTTEQIVSAGALVLGAEVPHSGVAYVLGFWFARVLRQRVRAARTTSIEVGMQNSGLAAPLAASAFTPATALPAAIFSIWHNLSGAMLSMYYRRSADKHPAETADSVAVEA